MQQKDVQERVHNKFCTSACTGKKIPEQRQRPATDTSIKLVAGLEESAGRLRWLYLGPYWWVIAMRARMTAVLTRLPRPWLLKTKTTVRPRYSRKLL